MMYGESIYNLVEKEYAPPPKDKRYKSKHNPKCPPSQSTFCLNNTSQLCGNPKGEIVPEQGHHMNTGMSGTFGKPKGALKPDTKGFTLKQTGNIIIPTRNLLIIYFLSWELCFLLFAFLFGFCLLF